MKMVVMAILIEYYWSSPSWKVVEKNRLVSGVDIVVWVPDGQYMGQEIKMVHMAILRE